MEKAICKTLAYSDIFDYPLKAWEIHKWLISKKASLQQVERVLKRLINDGRIGKRGDFYFLKNRISIVKKRLDREKQSEKFLEKAGRVGELLKTIPFIKLVGISGNLAMKNSSKNDDIDFFIITTKDRIFLTRILVLGLLSVLNLRRKRGQKTAEAAGKICINLLLEEDRLALDIKDIYIAHELLQLKVLWERGGIYNKLLDENGWAFKYLPNWLGKGVWLVESKGKSQSKQSQKRKSSIDYLGNLSEIISREFQLKIMRQSLLSSKMKKPQGDERILPGALYFHPNDHRKSALNAYHKKLEKLSLIS